MGTIIGSHYVIMPNIFRFFKIDDEVIRTLMLPMAAANSKVNIGQFKHPFQQKIWTVPITKH